MKSTPKAPVAVSESVTYFEPTVGELTMVTAFRSSIRSRVRSRKVSRARRPGPDPTSMPRSKRPRDPGVTVTKTRALEAASDAHTPGDFAVTVATASATPGPAPSGSVSRSAREAEVAPALMERQTYAREPPLLKKEKTA